MGYYAVMDGSIKPRDEAAAKEIERVLDEREYFEYYVDDVTNEFHIWQYEKYWDEEYTFLFENTHGLVESAELYLCGEYNTQWCFIYDPCTDGWDELQGRVVYDKGSTNELVAAIIEGFEDFLTEKGIWFANPERDGDDPNVDREGASLIYGTDYGALQTHIEDTLRHFGLI